MLSWFVPIYTICWQASGTIWFVWMIIMTAYTLSNRGMFVMVTGSVTMFITILPLYLYGAYTRAELNDKWSKIQIEKH